MNTTALDKARAAKIEIAELLRDIPELAGIGITRVGGGYGVKVNLSATPKRTLPLPTELRGVPIQCEVVGRIAKRHPTA